MHSLYHYPIFSVVIALGWAGDADLDEVRAAVAEYAPEDSEDLEALIFIGKREQELPPDVMSDS